MYNLENNIDEPICGAGTEIQTENRHRRQKKWGGMNWEIRADKYILPCIRHKQPVGTCCVATGALLSAPWWLPRGVDLRGREGR